MEDHPESNDAAPRDYGAPFDDADADIILRSVDLVDFRTHKVILAKASPLFRDPTNISLPPSDGLFHTLSLSAETRDGLPVLVTNEPTVILRGLLSVILALPPLLPMDFPQITHTIHTAQTYEMDHALPLIRALAFSPETGVLTSKNAFQSYGLACRLGLEDEAKLAVRLTLHARMSIEAYGDALCAVTGPALFQLWKYRKACERAVQNSLRAVGKHESESADVWWTEGTLREPCEGPRDEDDEPKWFVKFWDLEGTTGLACGPSSRVALHQSGFHAALHGHIKKDKCKTCMWRGWWQGPHFWRALQGEVQDALDEVELEFEA